MILVLYMIKELWFGEGSLRQLGWWIFSMVIRVKVEGYLPTHLLSKHSAPAPIRGQHWIIPTNKKTALPRLQLTVDCRGAYLATISEL